MTTAFPLRCWTEINLRAITDNVAAIRHSLPENTCYISVVKTDSYGLGIRRVVEALKSSGVGIFAVANVAEAAEVRQIEPKKPILLLSATLPEEDDSLFEYNLTPTLSTVEETRRYQQAAERNRRTLPVHLKFDTGMGRLGIWHTEADELLHAVAAAPLLEVRGIYSHLASAGEDADFTNFQIERFLEVSGRFSKRKDDLLIHIGNSSGLACVPQDGPFNAIRVGLLQFGILPTPDSPLARFHVTPAVSLHSRVSVVKELPAGTGISYGRTHTLKRDSRVAIVTAGYADGISRACSNRASVLVRGQRCPVLGNVTMDEIVIDVTEVPDVACGDRATHVGKQEGAEITLNEYSDWCRTIPWESLCAISKRVARVYV